MILKLFILFSICVFSLNGFWCPPCDRSECESVSSSCPSSRIVPDICSCCNVCGADEGEVCSSGQAKRCANGLRCETNFGCRYKYYLPWELPVTGKCVKEKQDEDDTPSYCYDMGWIMKQQSQ